MPSIAFYTLGCKVNQQETDQLKAMFRDAGYDIVSFEEKADVYLINTCTVTMMSDKKSRQMIARANARNPLAYLAIVGCYAQRAPDDVKNLAGVDLVVGTQHRDKLVEWVSEGRARVAVEDIQSARAFEALPTAAKSERTRVQVKLQDGCDRYCSYCIIPYARGPVRSLPEHEARRAITAVSDTGVGEAVLTGIHLMSYGKDLPGKPALSDLVRFAAEQPGIGRVRLGSLDPALIDEAFVSALAAIPEGKLARQFHLSLQSGSDTVLTRMGRRYTANEYALAAESLRAAFPGCALTTDVIAGFPGETEAEHLETLAFIERMRFARVHVFPYSRREGTKAAALANQVRRVEKERRASALIACGKALEAAYLNAQIGCELVALTEQTQDGWSEGYSDNYARCRYPGHREGLVKLEILAVQNAVLLGRPKGDQQDQQNQHGQYEIRKGEKGYGLHFLQDRGWRNTRQ